VQHGEGKKTDPRPLGTIVAEGGNPLRSMKREFASETQKEEEKELGGGIQRNSERKNLKGFDQMPKKGSEEASSDKGLRGVHWLMRPERSCKNKKRTWCLKN